MSAFLQTQRLSLVPLKLPQLRLCLKNLNTLESKLGLSISSEMLTEPVQRAIRMKIAKMRLTDEALHPWQTYWLVVVSDENVGVWLAGFKGVPDAQGITEIGYGIAPFYQNQGYMSEAVQALVDWVLQHSICNAITATEVEKPASRRLLEKLGAHLVAEGEKSTSWEFRR